ncbi:MAG: c-type cytochrome [Rhodospirillales bacterium]
MKKKTSTKLPAVLLGLLVLAFAWTVLSLVAPSPAAADNELQASIIRGGRLYDNWFKTTNAAPPMVRHPSYPPAGGLAGDPAQQWLCKECHGWDYRGKDGAYGAGRHYTAIKGINEMAGANPEKIAAILRNKTHGYKYLTATQGEITVLLGLVDEKDMRDLANFVSLGQVDMDMYIDRASKRAKGDRSRHSDHYNTICGGCHGRDGMKIRTIPPLSQVANENPWMAMHKLLNGHPDKKMPALRALGMQKLTDILAYIQGLPSENVLSSVARGGRLYDKWYDEIGVSPPTSRHRGYPADSELANNPAANWRCKECHGWDYMGKSGAYGKGKHFTGIKGVRGMAGADPERIARVIGDDMHGVRKITLANGRLVDADIIDIANFISLGLVDMDRFIDRKTGKAKGSSSRHADYFVTICATCHGLEGNEITSIPPLGRLARNNPWETLHKILNGHPGRNMPALRALDHQVLVDILAYAQTLPDGG